MNQSKLTCNQGIEMRNWLELSSLIAEQMRRTEMKFGLDRWFSRAGGVVSTSICMHSSLSLMAIAAAGPSCGGRGRGYTAVRFS